MSLSRIHRKLGTAGFIISIVALVAALGGGAYAASGGLTGKQKTEVEKIAKKYAGKPGATGPAGLAGSAGATGENGTNGTNGSDGKEGKQGAAGKEGAAGKAGASVTNTALAKGSSVCPEGGAEFKVGTAATHACNGTPGIQGPQGPQGPAGPTEHNYGVASLFLNGEKVADLWTPTIPMDHNNAATSSGSTVVECTTSPCKLSVRGVVRSDVPGFEGQAGVGIVVTSATNGVLAEAGQTPANPNHNNVKVVDVETVPLTSGSPTGITDGTEIPFGGPSAGELPPGRYIVQGTVEFFDLP